VILIRAASACCRQEKLPEKSERELQIDWTEFQYLQRGAGDPE
jgi:hypothetical protein